MPAARDLMIFAVGKAVLRPPGVADIHDAVLRPVNEQHRAAISLDFRKGVHVHDGAGIISSQLHGEAAQHVRHALRIKPIDHHMALAGVVRDAQGGIKEDQPRDGFRAEGFRGQRGNKAALAASHQGNRGGMILRPHGFHHGQQIRFLRQHRHIDGFPVALAAQAPAVKVKGKSQEALLRQRHGIVPRGALVGQKTVAHNHRRLAGRGLAKRKAADGKIPPLAGKCCFRHLHSRASRPSSNAPSYRSIPPMLLTLAYPRAWSRASA